MAGDNKQLNLRPADPFNRIDSKLNQVVLWSLHTFPENSCKSVQPFSRNVADKERKKERKKEKSPENNTPSPYRGRGNKYISIFNVGLRILPVRIYAYQTVVVIIVTPS